MVGIGERRGEGKKGERERESKAHLTTEVCAVPCSSSCLS